MEYLDETLVAQLPKLTPYILDWYDRSARVLPWRSTPTPYRVWISEIMLQQTRVEAVIGYFERFLAALPDVPSLAAASEETLMKLWEGLGYYSRARNLQKAAKIIMQDYDGQLPADFDALCALPGIGEYTAGAISSIAFGLAKPAVDGNVLRVLARILASGADITSPKVKKEFTAAVQGMIARDRPGDFTQSLMELGATVCLPNGAPLCLGCPVAHECRAFRQGRAIDLPVKPEKKARKLEQRTVLVIRCQEKLFVQQRPNTGLLAGLWEYVNLPGHYTLPQLTADLVKRGLTGNFIHLKPSKHIFTHIEWQMQGWLLNLDGDPPSPGETGRWVTKKELLEQYTLPTAFKAYTNVIKNDL